MKAGWNHRSGPGQWGVPAAGAALALLVGLGGMNQGLFLWINRVSEFTGPGLWANLTVLGDTLVVFSLMLPFVGRRPGLVWAMVLAALIGTAYVHGLKEFFNTDRPPAVFAPEAIRIIGEAHRSFSFPSGHTAAAFILAGLLCLRNDLRGGIKLAILAAAVLAGVSRIAVGVHWPVDVLAGAAGGWASAAAGVALARRFPWGERLGPQRGIALLLVGCAVALIFFHDSGYASARALEIGIGVGAIAMAWPGLTALFFPERK